MNSVQYFTVRTFLAQAIVTLTFDSAKREDLCATVEDTCKASTNQSLPSQEASFQYLYCMSESIGRLDCTAKH